MAKTKKVKGVDADLAPSRKEKKGLGQYILGFILLLYTLFCFLPVLLVFINLLPRLSNKKMED